MDDLTKTGKVKKKNDDGMSGKLEDTRTKQILDWIDPKATQNGVKKPPPEQLVTYNEKDHNGKTVGTDLMPI